MTPDFSFQDDAVAQVLATIEGGTRGILLVSPTGSGKTSMGTDVIKRYVDAGETRRCTGGSSRASAADGRSPL